ncbi:osteopetrosis-associated transmembrane protein 1-like [Limulus polyphemus]|uniref:Osteopetrosis-associated transmembrane protein 1-like n=1 Tax=Limulus polyphemus TaxID=6850 RepID=A0ABM1TC64_LIMPO|nr:osteopetrosis-associated transmembrane protein 1-like [Limulus polyphemus]XP_022253470.1 osteopetrosis-associated transmembrane protein 1-like [Limulus polyphemus]
MMYYKSEIIYMFMKLIIISTYVTTTLSSSAAIYAHGYTTVESLSSFGVKPNDTHSPVIPKFQNSEKDWTRKELLDMKVSRKTYQPPFKKKRVNVFQTDELKQDNPVSINLKNYLKSSQTENIQKRILFKSPSFDSYVHAPNFSVAEAANNNDGSEYRLPKPDNMCLNLLGDFANASSKFIMCSIINAKPVRVCSLCVKTFLHVKETYNRILKREEEGCKQKVLGEDRLMIVQTTYQNIVELWSNGCCDKCLDKDENGTMSHISEYTEKFFNLSMAVSECFKKYDIEIEKREANVCQNCKANYTEMNSFYESLKNKYGNSLCMDIVDLMNATRAQWSEIYKCHYFKVSESPIYGLTAMFCALPLLFYTISRIVTDVRSTTLLQTKRLSQLQSSLSTSIQED